MVLKVYVSDACGNAKIRKEQRYICRILEIKGIPYMSIDVGDPYQEKEKLFMQNKLKVNDHDIKALPPQIFFGEEYRGAFEDFFTAVECEELFNHLKMDTPEDEVEFERRMKKVGEAIERAAAPTVSVRPPIGGEKGQSEEVGEKETREKVKEEISEIGEKEKHSDERKEEDEKGGDALTAEGGNDESSAAEDSSKEESSSDAESAGEEEKTPEQKEGLPVEKGGDQVKAEEEESSSSEEDSSSEESTSDEEATDEEEKREVKKPAEKGGNQVMAEQKESSSEEESDSSDDSSSSESSSGEEE